MYVGFRYHHKEYPWDSREIVGLKPTRIWCFVTKHEFTNEYWTPAVMKLFVEKGHWIPEESLTTAVLKALKNAL